MDDEIRPVGPSSIFANDFMELANLNRQYAENDLFEREYEPADPRPEHNEPARWKVGDMTDALNRVTDVVKVPSGWLYFARRQRDGARMIWCERVPKKDQRED